MYKNHSVAVVVPAYNEESQIESTLKGMPAYVDAILVVDDGSTDKTADAVSELAAKDGRVALIQMTKNSGKGSAVARGCREAVDRQYEIVALMDGDNQMPGEYLSCLLDALLDDGFDAAKGNRFISSAEALSSMPGYRLFGNILLTMATKIASGYWSVFDSQNGYWAIRTRTLSRLDLSRLARGYDLESSLLVNLNIIGARLADVPIPARYGDEKSKIRIWRHLPSILVTLFAGFWQRIYQRYVLRNFHPVALFFFSGLLLTLWGVLFGMFVAIESLGTPAASTGTVMLAVLPFLMGFQLLLAALVLDILSEPK